MNLEGLKAVIIDDTFDEVKNLFPALDKKGISYNYYSNSAGFPKKPLEGIRLIFLDFELNFTSDVDNKTKVSLIQGYLKRIISQNNGPYILIIWAKAEIMADYEEVLKFLKEELPKTHKSLPLLIFDINKNKIKNDSEKIIQEIETKITLDNIVNVLLQWERFGQLALSDTMENIVNENITDKGNLDDFMTETNKKLKRDFKKFTQLDLGNNMSKDKNLIYTPQFLLNDFFKERCDSKIISFKGHSDKLVKEIFNIEELSYSDIEKANINTTFSLNFNNGFDFPKPGNIYFLEDLKGTIKKEFKLKTELKEELVKPYFKVSPISSDLTEIKIIALELTPECDFSQDHWKNFRLLLGVLLPLNLKEKFKFIKNNGTLDRSNLGDSIYTPLLIKNKLDNREYYISFDSKFFETVSKNILKGKLCKFSLRRQFFLDIQHWFAKHASRPGKIEFN
jgi:hypothetical protein